MKNISFRMLLLIAILIGACFYRYPVEIQTLKIKAEEFIKGTVLKGFVYKANENEVPAPAAAAKPALTKPKVVIVRLKNQRQLEGIIKETRGKNIFIDIGGGVIGIPKRDIKKIEMPSETEAKKILEAMGREEAAPQEASTGTTEINYRDKDRIIVSVLLNDKVTAPLILDTGAPYVVITPAVANQLFDINKIISKGVDMEWSDGKKIPGKLVLMESVSAGNARARNIKVVVAEVPFLDSGSQGLLGLSFLNYFNVTIDTANKKLILNKK